MIRGCDGGAYLACDGAHVHDNDVRASANGQQIVRLRGDGGCGVHRRECVNVHARRVRECDDGHAFRRPEISCQQS